ncbi:MAG TPA: NUDIX hydrolase [Cyclobacteriaceae bacterium]|jgi:8-oxo-dGTP pyrophosphatase MutT (NUDIX family)|nr:NUDIX hydrolase [Cyclobacteriaceae bacterium]
MITTRIELIHALENYTTDYIEEKEFCIRFLDLLKSERAYHRDHLPGHITGSAWIIDETKQYTLLTHHAKLNKWLQTGGHADGDENVLNVALREAEEESGLKNFKLLQPTIFDLDIHLIPERKDFPQHFHYDIRFLFEASMKEQLIISEESHDLAWKKIDEIDVLTNHNPSMIRMAEKTKLL